MSEPIDWEDTLKGLNAPDAGTRAKSARTLGKARVLEALPLLMRCLHKDEDHSVRAESARSIGLIVNRAGYHRFPKDVYEIITRSLVSRLKDPSPKVRERSAFSLGWLTHIEVNNDLEQLLHDEDPKVRGAAGYALLLHGSTSGFDQIVASISNRHIRTTRVLEHCRQRSLLVRDHKVLEFLVGVTRDTNENLYNRGLAIEGIALSLSDRARSVLTDCLHDPYTRIVGFALTGLELLANSERIPRTSECLPTIERLLRHSDKNIRKKANLVLEAIARSTSGPEL